MRAVLFILLVLFTKLVSGAGIAVSPARIHLDGADKKVRLFNPNEHEIFFNISADTQKLSVEPESGTILAGKSKDVSVSGNSQGKLFVSYFGEQSIVAVAAINVEYQQNIPPITGNVIFDSTHVKQGSVVVLFLIIIILAAYLIYVVKNG